MSILRKLYIDPGIFLYFCFYAIFLLFPNLSNKEPPDARGAASTRLNIRTIKQKKNDRRIKAAKIEMLIVA